MMRRPRKTPPLAVWQDDGVRVELHKQKVGYVLWAWNRLDSDSWEWSAFEAREDAEAMVREHYGFQEAA